MAPPELEEELRENQAQLRAGREASDAQRQAELAQASDALAAERTRASEMEEQLREAEVQMRAAQDAAEAALAHVAEAGQSEKLEAEIGRLQQQLQSRGEALSRIEARLEESREAAESAEGQAAALEAELQAVRWEKDDLEQRLAKASQSAGSSSEAARLREQLAAKTAELAEAKTLAQRRAAEAAAAEARAETLQFELAEVELGDVADSLDIPMSEDANGVSEKVEKLEAQLAQALRRAADAETLIRTAQRPSSADRAESLAAMQRLLLERDSLAEQVAGRDERIDKLQREVADKTSRLGKLAQEIGDLKSKGSLPPK